MRARWRWRSSSRGRARPATWRSRSSTRCRWRSGARGWRGLSPEAEEAAEDREPGPHREELGNRIPRPLIDTAGEKGRDRDCCGHEQTEAPRMPTQLERDAVEQRGEVVEDVACGTDRLRAE